MFYLVDKPIGPSSNQTLSHIRRHFCTKKAGHSGTLDPLASGLLIVATNGSTKLLSFLEKQSKWYQFTFDITKTSESLDLGTPVVPLPKNHQVYQLKPTHQDLEKILKSFAGVIEQVPPKYSAISQGGKRSYEEIRKGNPMELPTRKVEIYHLELLDYTFPNITLLVHISSGGYVRSLAQDIGIKLGGTGVVIALRRTQIDMLLFDTKKCMHLESHPGEVIGIQQVGYDVIFPNIGRIDLSEEEYITVSFGHAIAKRNEITRQKVFGYYQDRPVVLLEEKGDTYTPIKFKI